MDETSTRKKKLKAILVERLSGQCSKLLIDRMLAQIEAVDSKNLDFITCMEKIRVTIRLFVDETVAEEIYQKMLSAGVVCKNSDD